MAITVKNWKEFQHYKDRRPPWIKLHRHILDNYEFHCLQDASKALAPCIWLLASEYQGGEIPLDLPMMAFRFRMDIPKLQTCLQELQNKGFIDGYQDASAVLAPCYPNARLEEKRRGEESKDKGITNVIPSLTSSNNFQLSNTESKSKKSESLKKRGSRIPENFIPNQDHYLLGKKLGITVDLEFQKFKDYFLAAPGEKGVKLDWDATFRNWLRNSTHFSNGSNGNGNGTVKTRNEQLIEAFNRKMDSRTVHQGH